MREFKTCEKEKILIEIIKCLIFHNLRLILNDINKKNKKIQKIGIFIKKLFNFSQKNKLFSFTHIFQIKIFIQKTDFETASKF